MSDRFYFDGPLGPGDVTLEGPEAHHLANVRRFQVGDAVVVFNGDGREYPALVAELGKKRIALQVTDVHAPIRELPFSLHMAVALPKGDRGDFLIEKLTELGVTTFTPLISERSIVKIDDSKTEKLRRAVIEASKQCGRNVLMAIHGPARWAEWCPVQSARRLIAHPSDVDLMRRRPKRSEVDAASVGDGVDLAALRSPPHFKEHITVAIGPEGGFSDGEVATALAAGWERLSLGPRILRVETAAIAAAVLAGQT